MSLQQDPLKMSGGPVAPVGVAVMCHYLLHITASFDERKGTSYATVSACAEQSVAVRCGLVLV
jgi:hypothetical protein